MKNIVSIVIFLISFQCLYGQGLTEGITFDSSKSYYVITYCCAEDSSLHQGVYIPGHLVEPNISASVDFDSSSGLYEYLYSVENKEAASRLLYAFSLELDTKIQNLKSPDGSWSSNVIEWKSTVKWHNSRTRIKGIKPGSEETGFGLASTELPSIINALANSNSFTGFPDEGPGNAKLQKELDSLKQVTKHVPFKTIGPRKLPDDIGHAALSDTLQSYLTFSCDTTWIDNRGTCRSLEAKLENVKRQLDRDNTNAATGSLLALLNEVQALKEKQLAPEAYSLLYYNGRYLLTRLQNH